MSFSACQWASMRPFVIIGSVVACFVVIFFTYYRTDIKFPAFYMQRGNYSCPVVVCPERALTQESRPNCSTELLITPPPTDTPTTQVTAVDTEPDTIVLIWMWPFGSSFDLSCSAFNIEKCHLTDDKSLYNKAHGVLFHHRDIHGDLGGMPTEPRPWFQKWVWFNWESPAHSNQIPALNHLFNLTCNYRLDSNIPVPYGYLVPVTPEYESFKLPAKDKLVCWIVSNWNPRYKRVDFFNELKKHIEIHTYGNAFGQRVSHQDYQKIISSCKFYLSFENSVYKDYMTEKLFRPLNMGAVPVVLGPSRENYEEAVPGDSFIHIDDFPSPKELADRLLYLDKNETEYMNYFDWRSRFKVMESVFAQENACRTCAYLRTHRGYQSFNHLNKWYWG
ncbi:4-galactosyl-N-acetylglucosaminide 3-alpha-L-fucosyltransferase 9-like [Symphorus nematophorus]